MRERTRNLLLRGGALLFVIAITVLILVNRDQVRRFEELGYPGIFIIALIGSATVVFPVPHLAFVFAMGSVLNPWLVGLIAGVGDTVGELTGYLTGFALEDVAGRWELYKYFERWMHRAGDLVLFVLALVPNPLFDMASIVGGLSGFPLWRFLLATWAGKTLKFVGIAWAGFLGVRWILDLFR
ncbi:MAG: YqaA family protein [Anaerolineales bacterium]